MDANGRDARLGVLLTDAPGQVCDVVRETREHRLELLRRAA